MSLSLPPLLTTILDPPSTTSISSTTSLGPTSPPPTSIDTPSTTTSRTTSLPPTTTPIINTTSSTTSFDRTTTTSFSSLTSSSSFTPTETANVTTIVTVINGQQTTFTSHLPTALADQRPSDANMRRTAIIAGTTAALIAFMLMLLAAVFAYRRHKLRASLALGKKKEKKGLLDGEEFDDDDLPPGQHSSSSYHGAFLSSGRPGSPAPSLLKSRTSDAGSVFREEVWPPPGFVDPIEKRSNQVDLSKIVDDVMGPSATHGQSSSFASTSSTGYMGLPSASHDREPTDASTTSVHSTSSSAPLIGSNARHISDGHTYTDPFRSTPGSSSVYYPSLLPPGASAPAIPGSPTLSSRTRSSGPSYPTLTRTTPSPEPEHNQNQSQYQNLNAQPKKSSPLARALTGDAKLWLSRNVRQDPAPR